MLEEAFLRKQEGFETVPEFVDRGLVPNISKNSQSLWVVAHTTTLKPDPGGRQSFRGLFLSSI